MLRIDLNSDMGERPDAIRDGSEELLMQQITSANIACGVHAGDDSTMEAVVKLAVQHGVAIGAHPSFPDRKNFGRTEMDLPSEEIERCVYDQVRRLAQIAKQRNVEIAHVKPHGALYNVAVKDARVAEAIARGTMKFSKLLILFGLAGSKMLDVWRNLGVRVVGESFADRSYEKDGSLRSRKLPHSLIIDPEVAARRALRMVRDGRVTTVDGLELELHPETICIHSDTPNSAMIAKTVRGLLHAEGVHIVPILKTL